MKKEHKELIIGAVAVAIIAISCFVSFDKFGTFNPIKGGIGFAKIVIFNEDYAEVNDSPRVILTNPKNSTEIFTESLKTKAMSMLNGWVQDMLLKKTEKKKLLLPTIINML